MKKVHLTIVGMGKMRDLIWTSGITTSMSNVRESLHQYRGEDLRPDEMEIAVHVGSGRLIPDLIENCEYWKIPMIQASSSLRDTDGEIISIPENVGFPVINAPNLALPVVALFRVLPILGDLMKDLKLSVRVLESHQASKTSTPITAQKMAGYFGAEPDIVCSIRDTVTQQTLLNVPKEHLDGHAHHYLTLESGGVEVGIQTKINGRNPYIAGLELVVKKIVEAGDSLQPGIHQLDEFMFD